MESASKPTRRPDVVFRPLAEEWVILDPDTCELHVLNLSAALLWEELDGSQTEGQIAHTLWTAFDDAQPFEAVLSGVKDGVEGFRRKGLLRMTRSDVNERSVGS